MTFIAAKYRERVMPSIGPDHSYTLPVRKWMSEKCINKHSGEHSGIMSKIQCSTQQFLC